MGKITLEILAEKLFSYLAWASLLGLALLRLNFVNGDLIYQHSWGEGDYAIWADHYLNVKLIWGMPAFPRMVDGFTNYVPFSSLLVAGIQHYVKLSDVVTVGRALSYVCSLLTLFGCYKILRTFSLNRLQSIIGVSLLQALPLFFRYSTTFYNEPLSLLTLTYILFLQARILCDAPHASTWPKYLSLFIAALFFGLLKPTGLVTPLIISALLAWKIKSIKRSGMIAIAGASGITAAFILSQRIMFPNGIILGADRIIFLTDNIPGRVADLWKRVLTEEFGILKYLFLVAPLPFVLSLRSSKHHISFSALALICPASVGILFLPGTQVHAYYLLPATLGITLLVCTALNEIRSQSLQLLLLLSILIYVPASQALIKAKLLPVYPTDLPLAMRVASLVIKQESVTPACYVAVGQALPNHAFYLGTEKRKCTYDESAKAEATPEGQRGVYIIANSIENPILRAKLTSCGVLSSPSYKIYSCNKNSSNSGP